jgi:hypothetical protein
MSKSILSTLAVSLSGLAFIAYLYSKVLLAGYEVTIPFINVIISL